MSGHEPIDTLFLTAAIRVLEDGNRHKPNPLPGIVFHAVAPFQAIGYRAGSQIFNEKVIFGGLRFGHESLSRLAAA